ncbi:hypothetical protein DICPUDRAFT_148628 [Dictyostelium purpureum]|uniref:Uncharacterized protein n=1 Tax=Dictyostelium purpureum TaxID=5786 RepID=F0ZBL2_DICPU|nr:uncharacterized protein DICPUDRAFT_148628 [Dictyostelium purpureum]EGC38687.1 hypothetical protein DICPUDRAFT_148628 [Dictyostelium purpureum]|eukprot:XP_003284783.1 hypothetical protein DICPUDRAFT_148628 [Dictyostelium purpureum]
MNDVKTFELEEANSKLNIEIQVQVKKFNDLKVRAQSRLEDASEQLSEIKKVANKEIFKLGLKLKDSESKLKLKQLLDHAGKKPPLRFTGKAYPSIAKPINI